MNNGNAAMRIEANIQAMVDVYESIPWDII